MELTGRWQIGVISNNEVAGKRDDKVHTRTAAGTIYPRL